VFVYRSEDLYAEPARWVPRLLDHIGVEPGVVADTPMPHTSSDPGEPLDPATYAQVVERFRSADARLAELVGLSYYQAQP
jgi:hypothetical protein